MVKWAPFFWEGVGALDEVRGSGSTAEEDEAQGGGPVVARLKQALQHGGHERDEGRALGVQAVVDGVEVKAVVEDNGRAVQTTAQNHRQPAHVVERQHA
jgi:hypothetical protein